MHTYSFRSLFVAAGLMLVSASAFAWGQKGHDVTCAVAQKHLSRKTQKKVNEIFEGKSLVYWANWMDNASHTQEFGYTRTWHYKNIDAEETYETAAQNENGDVVTAIEAQIKALRSGELNHEQEAIALRFLVHLMGDLHCPMHMGHKSDLGGNRWQVQFFGQGRNLHSVWDSELVERAHKWTYTEWAQEIDTATKSQAKEIVKGSISDWGKETYQIASKLYDSTPVGSKLMYDYVSDWTPTAEEQLLRGGLRLAYILNEIFD